MYKKMKGVSFDPSLKTMVKNQALMQDYQELRKETEAIRNRFENTKQHKSVLLAEVRFLRRRHKHLLLVLRRKKRIPNERRRVVREAINKEQRFGLKPNTNILDLNQGEEELGEQVSRAPPVFDLNQIAREEDHDVDDFRPLMMNGTAADEDQKLPPCSRNAGKRKRKISWQDPVVALKVMV